jgi:hypothetical protein
MPKRQYRRRTGIADSAMLDCPIADCRLLFRLPIARLSMLFRLSITDYRLSMTLTPLYTADTSVPTSN